MRLPAERGLLQELELRGPCSVRRWGGTNGARAVVGAGREGGKARPSQSSMGERGAWDRLVLQRTHARLGRYGSGEVVDARAVGAQLQVRCVTAQVEMFDPMAHNGQA